MSNPTEIRLDTLLPHPPAEVWRALTEPDLIARWLMPNDFKLEVGHAFTFSTAPVPGTKFTGTVYSQVLGYEAPKWLRYSWSGSGENKLAATVNWQLESEGDGTHLYLTHAGFDPSDQYQLIAYRMMSAGWPPILQRLASVLDSR